MTNKAQGGQDLALADLLDRALSTGVVIWGEATISLAGVDLVYVGLKVLVASVDAAERMKAASLVDRPTDRGQQI
ncbi:GvpA-family gas vesicle protein [Octadecabacter antarcticus 307]|uniref:GvpA-family gas vesicle protein n=1 Tax=Octadecabacter antarcticus 307 TaxID=391626 RepID=M9RDV2_9RHOB|nr:gas vesicle protein [Octadecabacter antarcticus]AGI68586.1 GvpA-family gas vesicle protein [Octadecabacter antarcticus 307]